MAVVPKKRRYDAARRKEAAEATRRAILDAARSTFLERGYLATTMSSIAQRAGVALDTIYASIGGKPALFKLLVESAVSGSDRPVAALERDYVRAIREEADPRRKLALYARAICAIHLRLAPLFEVLQSAASADTELAALWSEISNRRARNMRLFAGDLKAADGLREGLDVEQAADIIWSMNSPEFYLLLVAQRGWAPERFEQWLSDAWARLLLKDP
ncbi:MAG TPA: helix-turn-helix domain-containing protein [Labilithrix sp.]|nr:helix-turn-helix domain-containing protein [Labilithrix sp.]